MYPFGCPLVSPEVVIDTTLPDALRRRVDSASNRNQ